MLIPEWDTNFLYFSDILPLKFSRFWKNLEGVLCSARIDFGLLPNTRDIWCRDFMPVQVGERKFVQFRYEPSYLRNYEAIKTNPLPVVSALGISSVEVSDIILDGGNLVYSNKAVVLTDRVFYENRNCLKSDVVEELYRLLEIEEVYFIPKQPYDLYGHVDGMLRFVNNSTLLVNDFSMESKIFLRKLEKALENMPFNIIVLKVPFEHRLKWCYINYIHVNNSIIVPTINHPKEDRVLQQFEEIFVNSSVWPLYSKDILMRGGGLHCISWNIKTY